MGRTYKGLFIRLKEELKTSSIENVLPTITSAGEFFFHLSKLKKYQYSDIIQNILKTVMNLLKQQHEKSLG